MDTYDTRIEALKALGNLKVNPTSIPTIEMLAEKIIDNLLKNPAPLSSSLTLEELEDEIKTAGSLFYPAAHPWEVVSA